MPVGYSTLKNANNEANIDYNDLPDAVDETNPNSVYVGYIKILERGR